MKFRSGISSLSVCAACVVWAAVTGAADPAGGSGSPAEARVVAAFDAECERLVLREIRAARREILMTAYVLTRREVISALKHAARRGVKVHIKYDKKQAEYEAMREAIADLKRRGIRRSPVRMSESYASMHHKFLVIDGARVLTGSYNFTTPASERNFENLVLIESPEVAARFSAAFAAIESR